TAAIFGISKWRSSRTTISPSVTTPAVAPAEWTLSYWITLQPFKDGKPVRNPFTLPAEAKSFAPDDRIRVNVLNPHSGYLYIINEGPATGAPEYNVVFPTPTANNGVSLLPSGQTVEIPKDSWLRFDTQQGAEKLWLVFSESLLPELESIKEFAGPRTGGLITDAALNKSIKVFLDTHSTTEPEIENSHGRTNLKVTGKLLV